MDLLRFAVSPTTLSCHGGCKSLDLDTEAATNKNSVALFNIFHVTFHSFPKHRRALRMSIAFLLLALWFAFVPGAVKLRAVLAAFAYTFIEYTFNAIAHEKGFTSDAQFGANLLYIPVLLDVYASVLLPHSPYIYILCFPLNVWLLELVEDRLFLITHGRNVAWCYHFYEDSHFGGVIRRGHGVCWLLMGAGALVMWTPLVEYTDLFVGAWREWRDLELGDAMM
jgi:hypothetical protein